MTQSNLSPKLIDTLRRFTPFLIVLLTVYSYYNACKGPLVFDDVLAITNNPSIRTLWPIWVPMFPEAHGGTAGRPLVGLSYAINYALDGLNARGYHAGNILLHALSTLTLWGVIRRALLRLSHPAAEAVALAATLIWTVHPLLTDTVAYIINRTEGSMSLFLLLALYTFLRSLDGPHARRWLALSVLCSLLSVACKEVGAMAGPVILVFDVLVATRSWKQTIRDRKLYYVGLLLSWILLPLLLSTASMNVKTGDSADYTSWQYLMMQSQVIPYYLRLAIWPSPLVIDYVGWPIPHSLIEVWPWMLAMGGLVLLTAFLVVRKKSAGLIGVWFFLILAPSSSILPLFSEPAAERRMYLPLVAVVMAALLLIERVSRRLYWRGPIAAIALSILILVEGQATLARNEDFSDAVVLWADTVAKRPHDPLAHAALGAELKQIGQYSAALKQLEMSIDLAPGYTKARIEHATVLAAMGRDDLAAGELGSILANEPGNNRAAIELGGSLFRLGRREEAIQLWRAVLARDPSNDTARALLGQAGTK